MRIEFSQRPNIEVEDWYNEYVMPIWRELDVPVKRTKNCVVEDLGVGGYYASVFRFQPTLTISREQFNRSINILHQPFEKMRGNKHA